MAELRIDRERLEYLEDWRDSLLAEKKWGAEISLDELCAILHDLRLYIGEEECRGAHDTGEMLWPGTAYQGVVCRNCKRFLPC